MSRTTTTTTTTKNPYSTSLDNLPRAYFEPLIKGDRIATRQVIDEALAGGVDARELLVDLVWPTMELLQSLFREDRLSTAQLNMATRLNRSLTDQIAARLPRKAMNDRTVLIFCGNDEPEELGGQIAAELFEADGWTVRFAGGGVPQDEVLKMIGDLRPNVLCMFATLASGVPSVRQLIDYLREVNSCPNMQVMCCGGIYKRAEGLAEEIGADLYGSDAADAVRVANAHPEKRATVDQQTVGRTRRIRKAAARREGQTTRATANVAAATTDFDSESEAA